MPEGPEIQRAADALSKTIVGQQLTRIILRYPPIRRYQTQLQNQTINRIEARGKAMVTHFDQGLTLYSHNQLYGLWQTATPSTPLLKNRQLRLELGSDAASIRLYSATDIEFLTPSQLKQHPYLGKLGPDILDPSLVSQDIVDRLANPRFTKHNLGALLLNQGFLAGIGNYLRSEILFAAGLDANIRVEALTSRSRRRLGQVAIKIANQSYRHDGVTRPQSHYRALRQQGADYETARFWVFDRAGEPCYRCDHAIAMRSQNQRRFYFCSECQPSP